MLQTTKQGNALTVYLTGEIDHCVAEGLRNEIEMLIVAHNPHRLILDFSQVSFMDSSGIGMVLGRYKKMKAQGGTVTIRRASRLIKQILDMSGVFTLMDCEDSAEEDIR